MNLRKDHYRIRFYVNETRPPFTRRPVCLKTKYGDGILFLSFIFLPVEDESELCPARNLMTLGYVARPFARGESKAS